MLQKILFSLLVLVIPFACASRDPEPPPPTDAGTTTDALADCEPGPRLCFSDTGVNPTLAGVALASARELRRWDPARDLTVAAPGAAGTTYEVVVLSESAKGACRPAGCPQLTALLGLQHPDASQTIDVATFDPVRFRAALVSGVTRQKAFEQYLAKTHPAELGPDHELSSERPRPKAKDQCGVRFVFKTAAPGGGRLAKPELIRNRMLAYGGTENPYLAFDVRGRRAAIDPIDGDNAPPTTTTGGCQTYELDRVWDPSGTLLGKCCVTQAGQNGALVPVQRAEGYVGCKAGATPTR